MSPARRREAVGEVQRGLGVSERRACRALGQPRATQRYRPRPREFQRRLVRRMLELVGEHPRYGYRRIWALLRREGWRVNRKRSVARGREGGHFRGGRGPDQWLRDGARDGTPRRVGLKQETGSQGGSRCVMRQMSSAAW